MPQFQSQLSRMPSALQMLGRAVAAVGSRFGQEVLAVAEGPVHVWQGVVEAAPASVWPPVAPGAGVALPVPSSVAEVVVG